MKGRLPTGSKLEIPTLIVTKLKKFAFIIKGEDESTTLKRPKQTNNKFHKPTTDIRFCE